MKSKKRAATAGYAVFLVIFLFIMIAPMLYMISASFMPESDLSRIPPKLLPSAATLENYGKALV